MKDRYLKTLPSLRKARFTVHFIIVLLITGNTVLLVVLWRLSDDYNTSSLLIGGVLIILSIISGILGLIGTVVVIMGLNEVLSRLGSIVVEEG